MVLVVCLLHEVSYGIYTSGMMLALKKVQIWEHFVFQPAVESPFNNDSKASWIGMAFENDD